jgi:hypothetical protein
MPRDFIATHQLAMFKGAIWARCARRGKLAWSSAGLSVAALIILQQYERPGRQLRCV